MSDKVKCQACGAEILPSTARIYGGNCAQCGKGWTWEKEDRAKEKRRNRELEGPMVQTLRNYRAGIITSDEWARKLLDLAIYEIRWLPKILPELTEEELATFSTLCKSLEDKEFRIEASHGFVIPITYENMVAKSEELTPRFDEIQACVSEFCESKNDAEV